MSKRIGRIEDYINDLLAEHPDDVVMNDELIFLRYGFKNRAVSELRRKEDHLVLCQFNGEGLLLRSFNEKPITCLSWRSILSVGLEPIAYGNPGIVIQRAGHTLRIWKTGSEDKSPLTITA